MANEQNLKPPFSKDDPNTARECQKKSAAARRRNLKKQKAFAETVRVIFETKVKDPKQLEIAQKYGVPIAKLCIKFCIQRGTLPLPKSVTPERIKDNISGLDFTISDGDMAELNALQNLYPRPFRT